MNTAKNMRRTLLIALMAMAISSADAHKRPALHRVVHAKTVVVKPVVVKKSVLRVDRNARLAALMAYLDTHENITAKKYAKLTGLSKGVAEAELNTFAFEKGNPIAVVTNGNKKVYVRS